MKIFKEFNRRRGISDKVRRVEEASSHVTKRGEEGTRLQARDLDSLLGKRDRRYDSVSIRIRIRRGISDKVRRVEETSSHVTTKRGEEGARLQARDLDSPLGTTDSGTIQSGSGSCFPSQPGSGSYAKTLKDLNYS